jgi:hypothetical protein
MQQSLNSPLENPKLDGSISDLFSAGSEVVAETGCRFSTIPTLGDADSSVAAEIHPHKQLFSNQGMISFRPLRGVQAQRAQGLRELV